MAASNRKSTIGRGSAHTVPWVTFALIAICVGVFTLTQWSARQAHEFAERELQSAITYLMGHPYLEPGAVLAARVDPTLLDQRRLLERQARMRRSAPPIPKRVQGREKKQLDELVASAYAGVADLPTQRWGFRASEFGPLTLLTHAFLHESSWHLIIGSFLLLLLGFHLEVAWGPGVFAAFVLLAGVISAGTYAAGNSGFEAPLIGFSGILSALLAAFAIAFRSIWKQPVYSFVLVSGAVFLIMPVRMGHEWSIAAGLEQMVVLVGNRGASYWAFAGGFAFGLFGEFMISQFRSVASAGAGESGGGSGRVASPLLEKAINAHAAGRANEAYSVLSNLLEQHPDDHEGLLVMWDVALDCGQPERASSAMIRAIRDEVKRDDLLAAVDHWLDLCNRGNRDSAEPALLIRLALMLERRNQRFAAVDALQCALARTEGDSGAVVATRVARASRDIDADTARAAAWRALGSLDLEFEERQSLEEMLAEIGAGIDTSALTRTEAPDVDMAAEFPEQPGVASNLEVVEPSEAWVDPVLSGDAGEEGEVGAVHRTEASDPAPAASLELSDFVTVDDGWAPPTGATSAAGPAPVEIRTISRSVRCVAATPVELADGGLRIEMEPGEKRRLPLAKVEAIAVAAVGGLGARPVILIDLVMNWSSCADGELRVVRLRGDRFDARAFVREPVSRIDAVRAFASELLQASGAAPLPDAKSAAGMPFASYDDLEAYQRTVLGVD